MAYYSAEDVVRLWITRIDDHDASLAAMGYPRPGPTLLDRLGEGDIMDLAEKISELMRPFRDFYRATAGYPGYDLSTATEACEEAERA